MKKGLVLFAAFALSLVLATAAQAKTFGLNGGGAQFHIGNGLALPIQQAATAAQTMTVFPPLLVPLAPHPLTGPGPVLSGTTVKPLITVVGKQGYQRTLMVPAGVLSKPAAQTTVGVKFSNPAAFAVGTNLNYVWPAAPATFSNANAVPVPTVAGNGGTMKYFNALGARFGGPAQGGITGGAPAGLFPATPVTIYVKFNTTTPACAHPLFGGTDSGCLALAVIAKPGPLGAIGGATSVSVVTPGGSAPDPRVMALAMGTDPLGTILAAARVAPGPALPNTAMSQAGPWTTGRVIISQPGPAEKFTLSGKDDRTAGGGGTIQMVAGSVSARATTGPNSNRGWVRLSMYPVSDTPALSPVGQAAVIGLVLLAGGYTLRRRVRFS